VKNVVVGIHEDNNIIMNKNCDSLIRKVVNKMPKVELTMNQWKMVLEATRAEILSCYEADDPKSSKDMWKFIMIQDRIVDVVLDEIKRKGGE